MDIHPRRVLLYKVRVVSAGRRTQHLEKVSPLYIRAIIACLEQLEVEEAGKMFLNPRPVRK